MFAINLGPNDTAAPKWGYHGDCDANTLLVNNMFEHISNQHQDVSTNSSNFIFYRKPIDVIR